MGLLYNSLWSLLVQSVERRQSNIKVEVVFLLSVESAILLCLAALVNNNPSTTSQLFTLEHVGFLQQAYYTGNSNGDEWQQCVMNVLELISCIGPHVSSSPILASMTTQLLLPLLNPSAASVVVQSVCLNAVFDCFAEERYYFFFSVFLSCHQ